MGVAEGVGETVGEAVTGDAVAVNCSAVEACACASLDAVEVGGAVLGTPLDAHPPKHNQATRPAAPNNWRMPTAVLMEEIRSAVALPGQGGPIPMLATQSQE